MPQIFELAGKVYSLDELILIPKDSVPAWAKSALDFIRLWVSGADEFTINTSGSTGIPKEIKISRKQMVASAWATLSYFSWNKEDVFWLVINAEYIGGKMLLVRAILSNASVIFSQPSTDVFSLKTILSPTVCSIVPLQIEGLNLALKNNSDQMEKLGTILVGGAAMTENQLKIAQEIPISAFQTYGMTETVSHIALRNVKWESNRGYELLDGIEIRTDENNCLAIKALVTNQEWIQTNDVVRLIDDKHFEVLHRLDDVVNSGGVKIPILEAEKLISNTLKDNLNLANNLFCFSIPDRNLGSCLAICFIEQVKFSKIQIIDLLKASLPKYWTPKRFFYSTHFPTTDSGKPKRRTVDTSQFTEVF